MTWCAESCMWTRREPVRGYAHKGKVRLPKVASAYLWQQTDILCGFRARRGTSSASALQAARVTKKVHHLTALMFAWLLRADLPILMEVHRRATRLRSSV